NRFFDTVAIQKGTSKLLIDFSAALLQMVFGVILLSLYHPFFIIFGVLLFGMLYFIFKFSFRSGLETSLKESKFKYKVASWLQEMARNNFSFKNDLNYNYGLQKNNNLVQNYLNCREKHFDVIKTQFSQLIVFKILITASLLSIGGFLVLSQQMNIGQFVAAEIIILLVITSVEKIIIGLETFYDVLTSIEKIGQVTDLELEVDVPFKGDNSYTNISLETENLFFKFPDSKKEILNAISLKIEQGEKIVIDGENGSGKTTLIRVLSGLLQPTNGSFYINDDTFRKINLKQYRSQIGSIIHNETPFEGTLLENITYNDNNISTEDLKWAIDGVQLSSYIKSLPKGLETRIFPEGKQLSSSNTQKLLLARSIIHKPNILFYEDPTDNMDEEVANEIIDFITSDKNKWTIIVSSKNPYWKTKCDRTITMQNGVVQLDLKTK
ncbi:MAG TPA: ATP-binding cassette domain-containing protein, partial [Flavobacterium sp.]|nr:ATP-binding cassette domain-containing protein [Flavobacterium sp.]